MSRPRASFSPTEGLVLTPSGGETFSNRLLTAARRAGGRRRGHSLVLDPSAAGSLLRDLDVEWEPLAQRATENRRAITANAPTVLAAARQVRVGGAEAARRSLGDCSLVDSLDDHQVLNVGVMTLSSGWGACVFDEQGTGKTVSVVAAFDTLAERNETHRLLIIAPKSMVGEWANEFQRFAGGLYQVGVVEGSRRERLAVIDGRTDIVVLNYEAVASLLEPLILLARRSDTTLVVDESYNVKNPRAQRSEALAVLREWCNRAFVLCGTPAPHSVQDLIAQVDLVDLGYTFGGLRIDEDAEVARDQVTDALNRRGLFTRNLKQDVLPDLPGRRFTTVAVELAPQQQAIYDEAAGQLIDDLRRVSDDEFRRERRRFLDRRASLLRICSDPAPLVTDYKELPAKITALDQLLTDLVQMRGEKVVLWSFYRSSLDRLAERYSHLGLVRIDGSVTDSTQRREAVSRFQNDPDTKIFLGNPAAAGAGLTLHAARFAVYESLGGQAAHHMQSIDRIHRRGQQRDAEYLTLLARDTVENAHYKRLLERASTQAKLLGDPPQEPRSRSVMLAELLGESSPSHAESAQTPPRNNDGS